MEHVRRFSSSPAGRAIKNLHVPQVLRSRLFLRYFVVVVLVSLALILVVNDPKRKLRAYHQGLYDGPSACKNSVTYKCDECIACALKGSKPASTRERNDWTWDWKRDSYNYALSDAQCEAAFTGLYHSIEDSLAAATNITVDDMDANMGQPGAIRAVIQEGQLYIHHISYPPKDKDKRAYRSRIFAVLSSLNRAITASPAPHLIPDVEFTMTVQDSTLEAYRDEPNRPVWAFTRRPEDDRVWLMPDFGSWSADELHIASYHEARVRIDEVEAQYRNHWKRKYNNIFWRGAVAEAEKLRGDLIRATEHMDWADVQALDRHAGSHTHDHAIEDYCRHMFLAVAEGKGYSRRLRYVQNCRSVLVAHRFQWITPLTHLLAASGPQQNYVQVERSWADLSRAIIRLRTNLDGAEKIADRSRQTFAERYATPAAEACYWRRLVREWARVTPRYEIYEEDMRRRWRGLPFETWLLNEQTQW